MQMNPIAIEVDVRRRGDQAFPPSERRLPDIARLLARKHQDLGVTAILAMNLDGRREARSQPVDRHLPALTRDPSSGGIDGHVAVRVKYELRRDSGPSEKQQRVGIVQPA